MEFLPFIIYLIIYSFRWFIWNLKQVFRFYKIFSKTIFFVNFADIYCHTLQRSVEFKINESSSVCVSMARNWQLRIFGIWAYLLVLNLKDLILKMQNWENQLEHKLCIEISTAQVQIHRNHLTQDFFLLIFLFFKEIQKL